MNRPGRVPDYQEVSHTMACSLQKKVSEKATFCVELCNPNLRGGYIQMNMLLPSVLPRPSRVALPRIARLVMLYAALGAAMWIIGDLLLTPAAAYAQTTGGGGGEAQIIGFFNNLRKFLTNLILIVAPIGILGCAIVKSLAAHDTQWHSLANYGIKSSLVGLAFAFLAGPIVTMIQSWTQ